MINTGISTDIPVKVCRPVRLLTTFPDVSSAERFAAHLTASRIPNQLESLQLWIERDDDIDRAKSELQAFQADPSHRRYEAAQSTVKKLTAAEEKVARRRRQKYIDVRTAWSAPQWNSVPVGIALILLSLLVGAATQIGRNTDSPVFDALLFETPERAVAVNPPDNRHPPKRFWEQWQQDEPQLTMWSSITRGQVWRLFSPMFLHFGVMHLVFNLYWLWSFALAIETRKGSIKFLLLVLLASLLCNLFQATWATYAEGGFNIFGGMSGVNYGLFGYLWMKGKFQPYEQLGLSSDTISIMLVWLVLCMTGLLGPVANAGHVGGLIAGMMVVLGPWAVQRTKRKLQKR